jgi:hypothetical protein
MKRATPDDEPVRASRKVHVVRFPSDTLDACIAKSCYKMPISPDEPLLLPSTPIMFLLLDEDHGQHRMAYWPSSLEIGLRVVKELENASDTYKHTKHYNDNIVLMDVLYGHAGGGSEGVTQNQTKFAHSCFGVTQLDELGVFRMVSEHRVHLHAIYVLPENLSPRLYTCVFHRWGEPIPRKMSRQELVEPRKSEYIKMKLVSNGATTNPDTVTGVAVLETDYMVHRAGVKGFLIRIDKSRFNKSISELHGIGYDSYHL